MKKSGVNEVRKKKNSRVFIKECTRKSKSVCTERAAVWSNLQMDLLGEIKNRVYLGDHVRFGAVCKTWRACPHNIRPADLLPWLMLIRREDVDIFLYKIFEPTSVRRVEATVFDSIKLDDTIIHTSFLTMLATGFACRYGWLFISVFYADFTISYLTLFSPLIKKIITLPPLPHLTPPDTFQISNFDFIHAFSCNPDSPHCVFLVLHIATAYSRTISVLRHGDKEWTCTKSFGGYFALPRVDYAVFVGGFFYFLYASGQLGSYNISTGELTGESVLTEDIFDNIHQFFELNGEIMLTFYDKTNKFAYTIRRYDWSNKVWVPLQSLGSRSLFISHHSFYVQARDNGLSPNSIYVLHKKKCTVYSLEDGQLLKCISGLKYWDDIHTGELFSLWIEPQPRLHLRSGESHGPGPTEEELPY